MGIGSSKLQGAYQRVDRQPLYDNALQKESPNSSPQLSPQLSPRSSPASSPTVAPVRPVSLPLRSPELQALRDKYIESCLAQDLPAIAKLQVRISREQIYDNSALERYKLDAGEGSFN